MDLDVLSIKLPLGYRFSPRDEELIEFLRLKNEGKESQVEQITEVDLCKWEPYELPHLSVNKVDDDPEWYFFCPRNQKYPKRSRLTKGGYWKVTGKSRDIKSRSSGKKLIGTKKTLVFHRGRASKVQRTNWIIHEYSMTHSAQDSFVLCRLFDKNENTEYSQSRGIESPDSSLSAIRSSSSSEGTPSNYAMVQETLCLDDGLGNMSTYSLVPEERHSNNHIASPVEDCESEEITKELMYKCILSDSDEA